MSLSQEALEQAQSTLQTLGYSQEHIDALQGGGQIINAAYIAASDAAHNVGVDTEVINIQVSGYPPEEQLTNIFSRHNMTDEQIQEFREDLEDDGFASTSKVIIAKDGHVLAKHENGEIVYNTNAMPNAEHQMDRAIQAATEAAAHGYDMEDPATQIEAMAGSPVNSVYRVMVERETASGIDHKGEAYQTYSSDISSDFQENGTPQNSMGSTGPSLIPGP